MATIALTPRPADAAVVVAVTGAGATVTVWRTAADGERSQLRGSPFPTQAGAVTVVDYEAPFGLVRYSTTDTGSDAVSTTLDVAVPWLTNPLSASFLSLPVTVTDDAAWMLPSRTHEFDVIDRADPIVTWYVRSTREGTLTLRYATAAHLSNLADLVSEGAPVLLRTPAGCPFPTGYRAVRDVRVIPDRPGARTGVVELDYRACAAPAGPPAGGSWTWADVPPAYATWAELRAAFGAWRDVVAYDPGGARVGASAAMFGA